MQISWHFALLKYTLNKCKWSLLCLPNWTLMELLVLCTPSTGLTHFLVYRKMCEFEDAWSITFVRRTLAQMKDQTNSIKVCHLWMQTVDNVSLVLNSPNNFVDGVYFTLHGIPISHIHLCNRRGGWAGSAPGPYFCRINNNFHFFLPWSTHQDSKTQLLYET